MKTTALLTVLAGVLATAAVASAARTTMVPLFAQQLLVKRSPLLAYVPTRIAAPSFRYSGLSASKKMVSETFSQTPKRKIVFTAVPFAGDCTSGKQKSFQLSGNKVYWAQGATSQSAWRCVTNAAGRRVKLSASSTLPPTAFADVGLGTIVASALRVR